jgi:hypothetical protein
MGASWGWVGKDVVAAGLTLREAKDVGVGAAELLLAWSGGEVAMAPTVGG